MGVTCYISLQFLSKPAVRDEQHEQLHMLSMARVPLLLHRIQEQFEVLHVGSK